MEKQVMQNDNIKNINIQLDQDDIFEYEILGAIKDFISDEERQKELFYHLTATDDSLSVDKQGYNTPTLERLTFATASLSNDEKNAALIQAYRCIEWRAGKHFINDAIHGNFNERVWFHDRRTNGSTLTENEFYEKIEQLREKTAVQKGR